MVATVAQVIGKVNPELYASNGKELLKKYKSADDIPAEEVEPQAAEDAGGNVAEHKIVYESYSDSLEPVYYFLLDLMDDFRLSPEKLVDNFSPTPGSTQFSEFGTKATAMQQQASKVMGDINTVLRSVLNIIYDLKEFQIRLQSYDDLHSDDDTKRKGALLSLKQVWIDKVDSQKGGSSIANMARQLGFETLYDAFKVANNIKDVERLDLNERVKRILIGKIHEFNAWLKSSEQELRKRFEIEKTYLRSQVNSLMLYSRWAKPYLRAAQQLEATPSSSPALVKAFNRTVLELTLLGKSKVKPKDAAIEGSLPEHFAKDKTLRKLKRDYYSCVLMDFTFTAVPKQTTYIGKAEVTFRAYALNQEEIDKIKKELAEDDIGDALKLIEGVTDESINQLKDDINHFLEGEIIEPEKEEEEKPVDESNPFLALVGAYGESGSKGKSKSGDEKIKPDDWNEKNYLRPLAVHNAVDTNFTLFDVYKKAHGMQSFT
ncbi:hypothetical protein GF378_02435 [Candidatus Pacearchaeota archaeon]|nr:hypothetical protein [Candidatus Pacearchaeota archaeon]